jgi:hypothetical protein
VIFCNLLACVLKEYRDEVVRRVGFRRPDHDTYRFHITIAYLIINLTDDEIKG